jgi:hypothetical protein
MKLDSQQAGFHEVQKLDQWWITLIIFGLAAMMWVMFVVQIIFGQSVGNNPSPDWMMWLLWIFVGIGLPIAWRRMHLLVEVRDAGIYIRFIPFARRDIPFSEIAAFEARTYDPIREYGGWGVKGGWGTGKRAYNTSGNQGVELTMQDGSKIMIGSQRPVELEAAIAAAMPAGG